MARSRRQVAALFALFPAYGCEDRPALEDLAQRDDVHVEVAFVHDQCRCTCDSLICWSFSCSSPGCSRADEYTMTLVRGPVSSDDECLDKAPALAVHLLAGDAAPREPRYTSIGCTTAELTWRMGAGQFDPASPHVVEIADETATWTIGDAFAPHTATLVAPATAATPEDGSQRVVAAGAQLVVAVEPAVSVMAARATIEKAVTGATTPSTLPIAGIEDDHVAISVPRETAAGLYRVAVSLEVALPAEACDGPPACHGRDAGTRWEVRVE